MDIHIHIHSNRVHRAPLCMFNVVAFYLAPYTVQLRCMQHVASNIKCMVMIGPATIALNSLFHATTNHERNAIDAI